MTIQIIWHRLCAFLADTWRQTGALWGAQGISVVSGLAYGKLIALFVAPAIWGEYNLQLATTLLVHSIIVSPLLQTYMSSLQQYSSAHAQRFYGRLLGWIYSLALLGTCVYALLYGHWVLCGMMWLSTVLQGAYMLNSSYFMAYGKMRQLALVQAISPLINLVLLLFIIGSERAINTSLLWTIGLLLNGSLWTVSLYYRRRQEENVPSMAPTASLVKHYRHYSLPLLTQAVFGWLTNYADRYLIGLLMTETAVGYYSAGYGMGARAAILGGPLLTRLTMDVYANRREGQPVLNTRPALKKSILTMWIMGTGCILLLSLILEPVGNALLSAQYQSAFIIIPIIAVAYLILTTTQMIESAFMAYEKTGYVLLNSVCTAVSNIGLNGMLIPRFGIQGAAYAMVISTFLQCILAAFLYRRLVSSIHL